MIEQQSLGGEVWRRFRRDKFAMIGLAVLAIMRDPKKSKNTRSNP